MNIWTKSFKFGEKATSTEQEHTTVPVILSASQITFCCRRIRLLNKPCHRKGLTLFDTTADIAITRLSVSWHNAKSHQLTSFGMRDRLLYRSSERIFISDHVICR
ncbi:hypothetical protein D3C71_1698800 [compost metagenome]